MIRGLGMDSFLGGHGDVAVVLVCRQMAVRFSILMR
jgi:hypothetical protein